MNESINQSIHQSINQLIHQSIDQSINRSINQSINRHPDSVTYLELIFVRADVATARRFQHSGHKELTTQSHSPRGRCRSPKSRIRHHIGQPNIPHIIRVQIVLRVHHPQRVHAVGPLLLVQQSLHVEQAQIRRLLQQPVARLGQDRGKWLQLGSSEETAVREDARYEISHTDHLHGRGTLDVENAQHVGEYLILCAALRPWRAVGVGSVGVHLQGDSFDGQNLSLKWKKLFFMWKNKNPQRASKRNEKFNQSVDQTKWINLIKSRKSSNQSTNQPIRLIESYQPSINESMDRSTGKSIQGKNRSLKTGFFHSKSIQFYIPYLNRIRSEQRIGLMNQRIQSIRHLGGEESRPHRWHHVIIANLLRHTLRVHPWLHPQSQPPDIPIRRLSIDLIYGIRHIHQRPAGLRAKLHRFTRAQLQRRAPQQPLVCPT